MTRFKKLLCISVLIIFVVKPYTGESQEISQKEIDSAIIKSARLIEDNYVFAGKGKTIASHLLSEHKKGRFRYAANWKAFDSLVTKSLQEFSHDGHLYVRNNPVIVKELLIDKQEMVEESSISENKAIENNYGFKEINILKGNIGYIKITEINISEKSIPFLFAAIQFVLNTKALIVDLQNNGGGGGDAGPVFESIFLPKGTPLLEFKTRDGSSSVDKTLDWLPIKRYEKPLYIIINRGTASAAEYYAFTLKLLKRAKIVGQKSAGAANMNTWYPINDQLYLSVSTASPTVPGTEESWELKGVQPDYIVEKGQEINFILTLLDKMQ